MAILTACEKIDELTQFTMNFDTSVTIPSTAGVNLPLDLFTPAIETNSQSKFEVNDTRKDLVEKIVLEELKLEHQSPENGDLSFLQSIEIFIQANGFPEVRLAWKDTIPQDIGKELNLNTTADDLKDYIKQDEFELRVKTEIDETLGAEQKILIRTQFFVDAKILGV